MKRSLRDITGNKEPEGTQNPNQPIQGIPGISTEDIQSALSQYSSMSEGQLINELLSMRSRGDITDAQLYQFANAVSPMLNDEMKQKLGQILSMMGK